MGIVGHQVAAAELYGDVGALLAQAAGLRCLGNGLGFLNYGDFDKVFLSGFT